MTIMKAELLLTKTRRPQLPLDWVARPRLSSKLAEAMCHRLAIVSAPPGYGKTTLVIEALRDVKKPVGWVSLDASDNVAGNYWVYFITALQNATPGIAQSVLDALQSPQPPSPELWLTALVNSLCGCKGEFVIVLDDYHTIEVKSIHEAMTFLVEHLPPQIHLVIASRHDPPLPLARWRVKGEIAEIRAADLSFTVEEAAVFVNNLTGIALSAQDLATLEDRTEGWIAGLKMAALALPGKADISSYIKAFSGSHHYVLDYLAEEVLNRQTSEVKQFLLETSILERLSGPLCDAVTERSDGQSRLEKLEAANLFISSLDDKRRWYRYHQLFATILSNQLAKNDSERVSLLHHRASLWYEGEGLFDEAISHSLLGGDATRAADLLENWAPHILNQGQTLALLAYHSRLPQSLIETHPWLCVSFAWAALLSHQWDLLSSMLSTADSARSLDSARMSPTSRANLRHIKGHLLAIQGFIAQGQGDIARSIQLSNDANRELSADDLFTRSANSINLAIDYLIVGDITQAIRHFEEAHKTAVQSGNNAVVLSSQAYLAETEMQRARFDRASRICRETIEQGRLLGGVSPLPYTAFAYILLGQLLYEQNDLEGAEANLTIGIQLAEASFNWTFLLKGCLIMAKLLQARGNSAASIEYLLRAEKVAPKAPQARESRQIPVWEAFLALRRGDIANASDWARQQETSLPLSKLPGYLQEFEYLTLVRLKLAEGQCRDLPIDLDQIIRNADSQGRKSVVIETLMLKAIALDCLSESAAAVATLDRAFSLAEPAGYVRTFTDEGVPLVALLRKAIAGGKHIDYATKLLDLLVVQSQDESKQPALNRTVPGMAEALSEREIEVLKLIVAGKSNQEIASGLFLAIGTVKKHIYNIFGKLGVESRTQAIARARELGLG